MENRIKLAIVGFGNVGKGVLKAIERNPDMELKAILSRDPDRVNKEIKDIQVYNISELSCLNGLDVAILCGGSKNDLPKFTPGFAALINTVDSYDNHSMLPEYFKKIDAVARENNKVSVISTGWDPGTFSLERVLGSSFVPDGKTYAFYGLTPEGGLSMGHSDAIRTIKGVVDARQYTHAKVETIEKLRKGEVSELSLRDMCWRECFVVAEDDSDLKKIEEEIKGMPGYFKPYETSVKFITKAELENKFSNFPHDGVVITVGETGNGNKAIIEYNNTWESNPEATGSILVAHARATYRLSQEKKSGAFTILDFPPSYLSRHSRDELISKFM